MIINLTVADEQSFIIVHGLAALQGLGSVNLEPPKLHVTVALTVVLEIIRTAVVQVVPRACSVRLVFGYDGKDATHLNY
jgi:hypothetical protein